jgi:hypothetical protein
MNSGTKDALKQGGWGALDNRGLSGVEASEADDAFILKMLAPLREARVWLPSATPEGVTDLRLHRVIIATGKDAVGLELRAGK